MRGRRLVAPDVATGVVLLWGALGLVVGLAVGALVHLVDRPRALTGTVYHGRYVVRPGITISGAYESTLRVTFDGAHQHDVAVLAGVAIGVLAGLLVGLALGFRPAWPSGRARR